MSSDENKLKLLRNESFIEPVIKNPFVSKIKFTILDRVKVRVLDFFKSRKRIINQMGI